METINKYLPSKETIDRFFIGYKFKPRLNHREQINAMLRQAVWSGKIKKPCSCSKCGVTGKRICGHHHNGYSKKYALDVVWLCDRCNSEEHQR
jgi:hypothetical protein